MCMKKINKVLSSLNKVTLLSLILLYAVLMGLAVTFVSGGQTYKDPYLPNYDHFTYNEDISTNYQIVHDYTYSGDELSFSVGVNARLYNRPGMVAINREFMTKALLENNKMHYFTQYSGYNYSVIHNQVIPATQKSSPKTIFSSMEYVDKDGFKKYVNFKEEILTLTNKEMADYKDEYNSDYIAISITPTLNGEKYDFNFKVNVSKPEESPDLVFHTDVQSWGVTKEGKVYPFMGYYNFSNLENDKMIDNDHSLPVKLGVTHLYVKVRYYNSNDMFSTMKHTEEILYKIELPAQ